jgi:hypothetical protein
MAAIDVREENDPLRDASRPYGQASADANALRALSSIGGGGATPPIPTTRSKDAPPPQPLRPLVAAGTPLPYAGPVASGQGGRNQGDDGGLTRPTFQSSDVLTQRALAMFPPAVQSAFANQKIERPADTSEIYGAPSRSVNIGGGYWPGSGKIALGRGIEQTSGPADAVNGTMHEILHAISHSGEGFAQDESAGYPQLTAALFDGLPALLANPVTRVRAEEAAQKITTDPSHSFTAIGDLYIHGAQLPAQLKAYFDQMRDYRPAGEQLEGAPAVEKGAVAPPRSAQRNPFPVQGSGAGVGDAASALGTTVDRFLHAGGAQVQQGWEKIAKSFPAAISALVPRAGNDNNLGQLLIGDVGGGLLQILGSPFTAAAETERTAMVKNVPELNTLYEDALDGSSEDRRVTRRSRRATS